jgi:hypothetical protein
MSAPERHGGAKITTIIRDFNALRSAIRSHDPENTEAAWEKCERWLGAVQTDEEALARRAVKLTLEEAADVAEFLGDPAPAIRALDPDAILARAKGE